MTEISPLVSEAREESDCRVTVRDVPDFAATSREGNEKRSFEVFEE